MGRGSTGDPVVPSPGSGSSFNPLSVMGAGVPGSSPPVADAETEIKLVRLRRAPGTETARIIGQVFSNQLTVAVDEPTNSLILKGTPKVLEAVVALVARLDELERSDGGRVTPPGKSP